jgi:hypothetical protein
MGHSENDAAGNQHPVSDRTSRIDSFYRAYKARLDDELYHHRYVVENVLRVLKQHYCDGLRSPKLVPVSSGNSPSNVPAKI